MSAEKRIALLSYVDFILDARGRKTAQACIDAGWEALVFSGRQAPYPAADDLKAPEAAVDETRYRVVPRTARLRGSLPFYRMLAWRSKCRVIANQLRSIKPDLIYITDLFCLGVGVRVAEELGVPVVYDAYEHWRSMWAPSNPMSTLPRALTARLLADEVMYAPRTTQVITVGEALARRLERELELPHPPAVVLNTVPWHTQVAQSVHDPVRLVFVGNLDPNRNVEVLVDAMDQVSGAVLAILGDGVQSDTVARHRSALAQPQRVQLLGRCAQEEVVARLSRHDVGIIAYIPNDAQLDEALPNKLFDYLAAGLAVAACPASALKHFKPAQGALRFMRVDTVAHLAADLATLVADRAWITSAKEAAVASGATLTWEVEQDRLVALLEGLM